MVDFMLYYVLYTNTFFLLYIYSFYVLQYII